MTQPPADQGWFTPPPPTRPYGAPPDPLRSSGPARQAGPKGPRHRVGPPLAAAWQRLLARIIDGIVVTGIAIAVGFPLFARYYQRVLDLYNQAQANPTLTLDTQTETLAFEALLVFYIVYFVYETLQLGAWGRTLGKLALRIRVIDALTGAKPSWGRASGRAAIFTLIPVVPTAGSIFVLLDVVWQLWDRPLRQCLHDKAARTVVVGA